MEDMHLKWLLINPEKLIHPPFCLVHIGSVLKANGHEVELIEIPFGVDREKYFRFVGNKVEKFIPDIIGITCMSMQTLICENLVRHIKENFCDIPIIVGGIHPTVASFEVLSWGADIAVRGEGEARRLLRNDSPRPLGGLEVRAT